MRVPSNYTVTPERLRIARKLEPPGRKNMKPNLKDLIKNNTVSFLEYRKGYLYYSIQDPATYLAYHEEDQLIYKFAVPISDIGDATFKATDKAIMFMRYIKKAIDEGTLVEI